jgi:hypothetical protein
MKGLRQLRERSPCEIVFMVAASSFDRTGDKIELDQHVVLRGMAWKDYEVVLAIRSEAAGVRLYYLDGEIELMSSTRDHEGNKTMLARLLEMWAVEASVDLNGLGSWTLKDARKEAGAEPELARNVNVSEATAVAARVMNHAKQMDAEETFHRGRGACDADASGSAVLRQDLEALSGQHAKNGLDVVVGSSVLGLERRERQPRLALRGWLGQWHLAPQLDGDLAPLVRVRPAEDLGAFAVDAARAFEDVFSPRRSRCLPT